MRPINIKIGWGHIRDGVPGSECNCPIALAVKDALLTEDVRVLAEAIYINGVRYDTDKEDVRFMARFDGGKRVKPYSFSIDRRTR